MTSARWTVFDSTGSEWPWVTDEPMSGDEVHAEATRLLTLCFPGEGRTVGRMHPGTNWQRINA